jgi:uncharacterized protein YjiS (DUF1127 family)
MDRVFRAGGQSAAKGGFAYLGRLLRRLRRLATEPLRRRAAIGELCRLGPRWLRDVGIEPYEIDAIVEDMLKRSRRDE